MPVDSIRINFQYGYSGSAASNTLATAKHNRTCSKMVNFIPMYDGSVVKRAPVTELPLHSQHIVYISRYFQQTGNQSDRHAGFAFFVHSPGSDLAVPVFILGDTGGSGVFTLYFASSPAVSSDAKYAHWIPKYQVGNAMIKQFSVASVITDAEIPATFGQLIKTTVTPYKAFYLQEIILRNGPCGSQERKDGALYRWAVEPDASRGMRYGVNPGDKIRLIIRAEAGIDIRNYIGSTIAFNVPVTSVDPFFKNAEGSVEYEAYKAVVYHGDNMYMAWYKNYKPYGDAPPPTHTTSGEAIYYSDGRFQYGATSRTDMGAWLFLNNGTGYLRIDSSEGEDGNGNTHAICTVQTALAPLHYTENLSLQPDSPESSWNLPAYGPGVGYFDACAVAFDRLWLGGGRAIETVFDVPDLSTEFDRANTVFASETADWENFNEKIEGPTRARSLSISSRGGSPVLDIAALDPQSISIFYADGVSVLEMNAEGDINTKDAANMRPAAKPYGCKFGPYTCCIGANSRNIVGAIYRYENNTQVTVDLLGPIYDTMGKTTIKRLYSIGGTPEKLIILRSDGVVTVLFLINGSEIGFYDVVTEIPVFDLSYSGSVLYMFHTQPPYDAANIKLSKLDLEDTAYAGDYIEFGKPVSASITLNSVMPPMDAAQETWLSADTVYQVRVNKTRNPLKINNYYDESTANSVSVTAVINKNALQEDDVITLSSDTKDPLSIRWMEVAYERGIVNVKGRGAQQQ